MNRTKVLISYSHKDVVWLERLQVHLKPLEREGLIDPWDDTRFRTSERASMSQFVMNWNSYEKHLFMAI